MVSLGIILILVLIAGCTGCKKADSAELKDGKYMVNVALEGGSGRASITSPAQLTVQDKKAMIQIEWSSSNYDYMVVEDVKYEPVNTEGNSVFEIPVTVFDEPFALTADTTAMSTPHEVDYKLTIDSPNKEQAENGQDGSANASEKNETNKSAKTTESDENDAGAKLTGNDKVASHKISKSLTYIHSMQLDYATEFSVDDYQDGFSLITISDGSRFLVNTQNQTVPDDLNSDIKVIDHIPENIYLVASATMDMFSSINALDHISLSGTKEENWYIDTAKEAMKTGSIKYAGKYSAPDYEQILAEDCDLAIESTMILHSPDVKEKLESFKIPVLVDYSSYETHPLGRCEWVKLYGVLTGKEGEAETAFKEQESLFQELGKVESTGKTVVFFYITSNETVVVRKTNDYVSKMIDLAGGEYLFTNLKEDDNASSSVNMQMEEFYAKAKDADYLVYNSTIDGELSSIKELLSKSNFLKDFKAVQEGNVWCTTKNIYQGSMSSGQMIKEFHTMLTAEDTDSEESTYLYKLQ